MSPRAKSQNPLNPDFVPTIFPYLSSPDKRKRMNQMTRFKQTQELKRKRACNLDKRETGKEEEVVEMDKDDRQELDREDGHELDEEDGQEIDRGDEEGLRGDEEGLRGDEEGLGGDEEGLGGDEEGLGGDEEGLGGDEEGLGGKDGHELDGEEDGQEIDREEPGLETSSAVGLALDRSCGNAFCEATMKQLKEECIRLQTENWKLKGQLMCFMYQRQLLVGFSTTH
ncbi:unnamed protein product [Leuciscus chuanchicus]